MNSILFAVFLITIAAAYGCDAIVNEESDEKSIIALRSRNDSSSAILQDVTNNRTIRGVFTGENGTGTVKAGYTIRDGYYMTALIENLPQPKGDDFYEGWLVRRGGNFDVISTGRLKLINGTYIDAYASEKDLADHKTYVLTLEPNDGNT